MECPRCADPLEEVQLDQITLDQCPTCRGIWFDFAELGPVLSMARRELHKLGDKGETPGDGRTEKEKLYCPRCESRLVRVRSTENPNVSLRGCLSCYGHWLDGSAIHAIKHESLRSKMKHILSEIW